MRPKLLHSIVFTCAMLTCATSATAQMTEDTGEPRPAGWVLVPSMTFSGGWDDNVLLVGLDEGKPADYVTGLGPGGTIEFRNARTDFIGGYNGAFALYRDLGELNSIDQHARARLQYRATRYTTLVVGQSLASSPTTDGIELVGVPFRRIGNRTSVTQGLVERRLTPRTALRGGYDLRIVRFDDEAGELVTFPGGHEHHFSGGLDHRLSPRLMVGGTYDLRRVNVSGRNRGPAVLGGELVTVQSSAGTVEYRASEQITLFGSMGVSHLGAGQTHPSRSGLAWRGGMAARLEHAEVTAAYTRSVVPSFGFGGTFQNEELVGNVRVPFARNRAHWQANVAWRDNDPLIEGPFSTRSLWFTSLLGYTLAPWVRVEGYYSAGNQDTQRPGGEVSRNRLGFQIVTSKVIRMEP
jgi:hypothetical protein